MEIFAMCTQRIFLQICSEIILKIGLHLPKLLIFLSNIKGLVFWNTVYNNTVIGTVAVDGWAVTFGTARRGLDGLRPHPSPPRCNKCTSPPVNGQRTNFILHVFDVAL